MGMVRGLLLFKLGVWTGTIGAAAFVRHAVPSRGDEDSDDVDLVAVFNGIELRSRARAFRGGSMLAWYGGIQVDLSEAELAPGAQLSLHTLFGGIDIKTPRHWRVESELKALAGGVDARSSAEDADAPLLTLSGRALFGGIAVGAKGGANDRPAPAAGPSVSGGGN